MSFLQFPLDRLEEIPFETGAPKPERVMAGAPRFRTWNLETQKDDTLFSGVWESTPGQWRIEYDEWEFCSIIAGESIIAGDDGSLLHVRAGDSFVIRPGFKGSWNVLETTRKLYVVSL